jgi:uncharacterized protein
MKKLAVALLLSCSVATLAHAEPPAKLRSESAKEKDIRRLLQLTGAAALGAQVMSQMLDTFKTTMPNVPANFWTELSKELNPDELVERVIPVYDKQLTGPEIKDLIQFYETPTGKKLIKVMPAITQESMAIGKEWGRAIGEKVMRKLQQKGLDKQK